MQKLKLASRKERRDIIESIDTGAFPEGAIAKKMSLVFSSCIEDIEDSLNKNAEASTSLSNKVWWLNLFILIATVAGVVITGVALYCKVTRKLT